MAKKYYQSKKDRMDESRGMKKKMKKSSGMANPFQAFPPDNNMSGMEQDQSMFGFPASSRVVAYPEVDRLYQGNGPNQDSITGTDYEIDLNVGGLNRNKSDQRF